MLRFANWWAKRHFCCLVLIVFNETDSQCFSTKTRFVTQRSQHGFSDTLPAVRFNTCTWQKLLVSLLRKSFSLLRFKGSLCIIEQYSLRNIYLEKGKHCIYSCNKGKLDNLSYVKNLMELKTIFSEALGGCGSEKWCESLLWLKSYFQLLLQSNSVVNARYVSLFTPWPCYID